jgi:tetratricopeptide (TPR) repeat protein
MKKSYVIVALALAVGLLACMPELARAQSIKDPAEYNAYVGALNQQDPRARISALEGFLIQYPNTVAKEDALLGLLGAYFQTQNQAKAIETSNRILQVNPDSLRGLVVLVSTKRAAAQANQNPQQNLAEAKQLAERGLQAITTAKPREGEPPADFETLKTQAGIIFHGAIGLAAMQDKQYDVAQKNLRAAVEANPNDVNDVYALATAYLSSVPADDVNGLWFTARAANLVAGTPAEKQISDFGRKRYRHYHGSEEGWPELLAQTKGTPLPPSGFTIKPAPTPAEMAQQMVDSKAVREMNFAEFEFILGVGGAPAEKVWTELQGKPLRFQGKVIGASRTTVRLAATQDAIDENRADVELTMAAALPVRLVPKAGADIAVEGEPTAYDAKPFVMKMQNGTLLQTGGASRPRGR